MPFKPLSRDNVPGHEAVELRLQSIDSNVALAEAFYDFNTRNIITKDEIGSSWGVNAYLNERFNDQIDRKKHKAYTTTPLVCMCASTLERSIFWMREMSYAALLENRIKAGDHLELPFESQSKYVHKGPTRGVLTHLDVLTKLTDATVKDFGIYDP